MDTQEPLSRVTGWARWATVLLGAISLSASPGTAGPSPQDSPPEVDERAAREELARLESFFQEISEDESESKTTVREGADNVIKKHGGIPKGGSHTDVNEHIKKCTECREVRALATAKGGLWDHAWMYRKGAAAFRRHLLEGSTPKTADAARYYLGECLWNLGEEEEALDLWGQVVRASDEQTAALGAVRLGDHHLEGKDYEKALGHFQAGAANSIDIEERLRLRLEVGRCLSILGKGKEAKRALAALAKEIPAGAKDRQQEKLRIFAMIYLEYPPRRGRDLGAAKALGWYEKVFAEHKANQEQIRKASTADRVALNLRRDALADAIRINLEDWNGLAHPKILYTLQVILSDARNTLGVDAARELIQIGTPDTLEPLVRMLQHRQGSYRDKILDALGEAGVEIDGSIVERTFQNEKEVVLVRVAAARYLARRDSPAAVTTLLGEVMELPVVDPGVPKKGADPRAQTRQLNVGIRDALSGMESPEAIQAIGEIAGDRKALLRRRAVAIEALGGSGTPEASDALLPLLDAPEEAIVSSSAEALGRLGDPRAREALSRILQEKAGESGLLPGLLRGLDRLGPRENDVDVLLGLAGSGEHDNRVLAHALLRQIDDARARERLIDAVDDKDRHNRWHAVRGVGQAPPTAEAVSALIAWLPEEKNHRVSYQILKYLNRMTDARLGPDPEAWQEWWEEAKEDYDPSSGRVAPPVKKGDENRTLTRYFTLEIKSKKLIFLLDISGSMEAKITVPEGPMSTRRIRDKKINIAKRELIKVLKAFKRGTSYNVMAFSTDYTALWDRLHKATRSNTARAEEVINGLSAVGGTNIYDTLVQALKDRKADTIYLLSDGEPTDGTIKDPEEILKSIASLNGAKKVKIHTIDLSGQSIFLSRLSRENGGRYVSVLYWE